MRLPLKNKIFFFLPHWDLNHGHLEPIASALTPFGESIVNSLLSCCKFSYNKISGFTKCKLKLFQQCVEDKFYRGHCFFFRLVSKLGYF